mmetsp:Transcript_8637/g.28294  ORF Transcript_8637/g.28294 Transcript_8637/m.28294 type:complete len:91 (+) Transcript_8637:79-351(+)
MRGLLFPAATFQSSGVFFRGAGRTEEATERKAAIDPIETESNRWVHTSNTRRQKAGCDFLLLEESFPPQREDTKDRVVCVVCLTKTDEGS